MKVAQEDGSPEKAETWQEVYERLKKSTPAERMDMVLQLIEAHPHRKLELPVRGRVRANLGQVDLSTATLKARRDQLKHGSPPWWDDYLQEANLEGANLQGAYLEGANLQGTYLNYANLQKAILREANLQKADLVFAKLQEADLWNAKLQKAILWEANLQEANLREANLQGACLRGANLQRVDLLQCESMAHIYILHAWLDHTRLQHEQLGGAIGEELDAENKLLNSQERAEYYGVAKRAYLALKQNFDDLGDYEGSNWAYRKERRMEKREAREKARAAFANREWREALSNGQQYLADTIVEIVCDYGESFWRVLVWIVAFIFVIGPAIFWVFGHFEWPQSSQDTYFRYSYRWQQQVYTYYQLLLYTIDTFTTANFAELTPANAVARLVSGCLAMFGIFLVGLLGFVAGNRIRRS